MENVRRNFLLLFLVSIVFLSKIYSQNIIEPLSYSTVTVLEISASSNVVPVNFSEESISPEETLLEEEVLQLDELYDQLDETIEVNIESGEEQRETISNSVSLDETVSMVQDENELLEGMLQQPLDLNTATYTQLKSLPNITPQLAREIIKHRRTRPFKNKKSLQTVKGMTPEIYKKILPYITVKLPESVKSEKKLKGQVRIRTRTSKPDDATYLNFYSTSPLRNPIYYYNRTQISYYSKLDGGYLFLYRPEEPKITPSLIQRFYLKKWWLKLYSLPVVERIVVGNYRAGFGYGLTFYDNTTETIRPVKPKPRGLREDKSSTYNTNLYGLAAETVFGPVEVAVLYSNKRYQLKSSHITSDNYVNYDLLDIRNVDITFGSDVSKLGENYEEYVLNELNKSSLTEQLLGFDIVTNISNVRFGVCGYESYFDKVFDPDKSNSSGYTLTDKYSEFWLNVFRGNNLSLGSVYFDFPSESFNIFGEYAVSFSGGGKDKDGKEIVSQQDKGINLGIILPYKKLNYYLLYSNLGPKFYSLHGLGFRVYPDSENGQEGLRYGMEYEINKLKLKFNYATALVNKTLWTGYSTTTSPRFPSKYNEVLLESKYKIKNTEVYFRLLDSSQEKYVKLSNYSDLLPSQYDQITKWDLKRRYQMKHSFTDNLSLQLRYENRWNVYELPYIENVSYYGELVYFSVKYKFSNFVIKSGYKLFGADRDVYLSYLDEQWYNVYLSDTEDSSFGDKFYLTVANKLTKNTVLWFRYRYKYYYSKSGVDTKDLVDLDKILSSMDHDFRFQIDFNF